MPDDRRRPAPERPPTVVSADEDISRQRISVLLIARDTPPLAAALADRGLRPDITRTLDYAATHRLVRSEPATADTSTRYDAVVFLPDRSDSVPDAVGILRRRHPDAVLTVIADTADETILQALDAGADDHWTPGSHPTAVAARIRAHVRRRRREKQARSAAEQPADDREPGRTRRNAAQRTSTVDTPTRRAIGDLTVDAGARSCTVHGHPLRLRRTQFDLLAALAATPGESLTVQELVSAAWTTDARVHRKTLAVHLSAIRGLLQAAYEEHQVPLPRRATIVSRRRRGYALAVDAP